MMSAEAGESRLFAFRRTNQPFPGREVAGYLYLYSPGRRPGFAFPVL